MFRGSLEKEFEKRKPWVTKFVISGREYGGTYDALNDRRVDQFFQFFPDAKTILELGSLEGGHAFSLAKLPGVKRIVGIEGRQKNIDKARFIQTLLGIGNVEFKRANFENCDLSAFGQFDAVFCVGLLYHLQRPWEFLNQISQVSTNLFMWTHYAEELRAKEVIEGFKGLFYRESGLADPLSGLSTTSFWSTLDSLKLMLQRHGFKNIQIIEDNPTHPHGPCITLAATAP